MSSPGSAAALYLGSYLWLGGGATSHFALLLYPPFVEVSTARVTSTGSGSLKRRSRCRSSRSSETEKLLRNSPASPPVWRRSGEAAPPCGRAHPAPTPRRTQAWYNTQCKRLLAKRRSCSGRPSFFPRSLIEFTAFPRRDSIVECI